MKEVLIKINKALKENKEIVDFISKIILTIVSISIAINANKIARRQMRIDELQIRPDIIIENNKEKEVIEIKNNGSSIYNIEIEFKSMLKIITIDEETKKIKSTKIPISMYYLYDSKTGNEKGLIATIFPNSLYHNYDKLEEDLTEKISEKNKDVVMQVQTYISISYKDQLDKSYNDYFMVTDYKAERVEKEEMDAILENKEAIRLNEDYYDYILNLI